MKHSFGVLKELVKWVNEGNAEICEDLKNFISI